MVTIEAGLFFLMLGLAMLGFVLIRRLVDFMIVSMVLFMSLSLLLFSGYDVVVTKVVAASTVIETQYDNASNLLTNTTIITPESTEQTSLITGMHIALGWTFFAMSLISLFMWLKLGLLNR